MAMPAYVMTVAQYIECRTKDGECKLVEGDPVSWRAGASKGIVRTPRYLVKDCFRVSISQSDDYMLDFYQVSIYDYRLGYRDNYAENEGETDWSGSDDWDQYADDDK